MTKRYRAHEISDAISELSDTEESDFPDSCSEYLPEQPRPEDSDSDDSELSSDSEQEDSVNEDNDDAESNSNSGDSLSTTNTVLWTNVPPGFQPKLNISQDRPCTIHPDITLTTSILDIFLKLFPYSLLLQIAYYTNKRLSIFQNAKTKRRKLVPTDAHEIMKLFGCFFVMSYNRLPSINNYWSKHQSMGNALIKSAFSRDRFKLIMSKLYVAEPDKPSQASKLYYVEDLLLCLKSTFMKYRQNSPFQSIDKSMTKFKGRCSFKQYLPMKPVKRGIKLWMRCDPQSGYTYDVNVYTGKDDQGLSIPLGEKVVKTLLSTIPDGDDVTVAFDRFFTSVHLMDTLRYPAVGTAIKSRKNLPVFQDKLSRGDSEFRCNMNRTLAVRWLDTKEVLLLSNFHTNTVGEVRKKQRDGTIINIPCPDAIWCYRQIMGGVDRADQMAGLYELDRKSTKWWKKVIYRMLAFSAVNAWVIYKELHRHYKKSYLDFLVELAEALIQRGESGSTVKHRSATGKPSKRASMMQNLGTHLPYEGNTRRRCTNCGKDKKQKRTKLICSACNLPYCIDCFKLCHS